MTTGSPNGRQPVLSLLTGSRVKLGLNVLLSVAIIFSVATVSLFTEYRGKSNRSQRYRENYSEVDKGSRG